MVCGGNQEASAEMKSFAIKISFLPVHEMLDVKEEQAHLNGEKPDVDVVPGEVAQHPHLPTLDVQAEVVHLGWDWGGHIMR